MVEFLCHEVPAKCHYRPPGAGARAVFRTVFSVAFTVRFVTFSVVMGDGKGAWFPCRNELMPRKPATIIQKTARAHRLRRASGAAGAWPLAQVVVLEGPPPTTMI